MSNNEPSEEERNDFTQTMINDMKERQCIRCHQPGREDGSLMHAECREELRKKLYGEEEEA